MHRRAYRGADMNENMDEATINLSDYIQEQLVMLAATDPEKMGICQILMIVNNISTCGGNIIEAFDAHGNIDKPLLKDKIDELSLLLEKLKARTGL